jgi:hypothetical protein
MADAVIQLPPDGSGKNLDAVILSIAGNTVYREKLVIADGGTDNLLGIDGSGRITVNAGTGFGGSNAAAGPTGSAVPASADYVGVNIAGNLVGVTGISLTNAKAATVAIVDASGNQITSFGGGTQFADNAASGATPTGTLSMGWDSANSKVRALKVDASQNLDVNISASSATVPISGAVSFTVPQHVIVDSATLGTVSENLTQIAGNPVRTSGVVGSLTVGGASADQLAILGNPIPIGIDNATTISIPTSAAGIGDGDAGGRTLYSGISLFNGTTWDRLRGGATTGSIAADITDRTARLLGNARIQDGSGIALTSTGAALDVNLKTSSINIGVTQQTTPWLVAGQLTHNTAAPGTNNVGVLPGLANATAPVYTEGDQVLLSLDLNAGLRQIAAIQPVSTANWTSATPQNTVLTVNCGSYPSITIVQNSDGNVTGGVMTFQASSDGVNWSAIYAAATTLTPSIVPLQTQNLTGAAIRVFSLNVAGYLKFRINLTTAITGTGTVALSIQPTSATGALAPGMVFVQGPVASGASNAAATQPVKVAGVFNTTQPTVASGSVVDAQSTTHGAVIVATGTDPFSVVFGSPQHVIIDTNPLPVSQSGLWSVNQAIGVAGFEKITDGTNTAAVKAASTVTIATDPSLVVAFSPNSPLPAGTNVIGALAANQSVSLTQTVGTSFGTAVVNYGLSQLVDEKGNLVQFSEHQNLSQAVYMELKAIRKGIQSLAVDVDSDLMELAQEDEDQPF